MSHGMPWAVGKIERTVPEEVHGWELANLEISVAAIKG